MPKTNSVPDTLFIYARKKRGHQSFLRLRLNAIKGAVRLYRYIVRSYTKDGQEVQLGAPKR